MNLRFLKASKGNLIKKFPLIFSFFCFTRLCQTTISNISTVSDNFFGIPIWKGIIYKVGNMIDVLDSVAIFEKADKLRLERGWSYYELATKANVSYSAIYNWRYRKSSPTLYLLESVCQAYGITLISFLLDEEEYADLTHEQKDLVTQWVTLTKEQKTAVLSLIKSMKRV